MFLESFSQFWGCLADLSYDAIVFTYRDGIMRLVMDTPSEATHQHKLPKKYQLLNTKAFLLTNIRLLAVLFFVDNVVGGCNERRLEWYRW